MLQGSSRCSKNKSIQWAEVNTWRIYNVDPNLSIFSRSPFICIILNKHIGEDACLIRGYYTDRWTLINTQMNSSNSWVIIDYKA